MGSDQNAHQSHQLLTHAKGCDSQQGLALPAAICEMAQFKHSCRHTSYTAICRLGTLCESATQYGICQKLYEAHKV